MWAVAKKEFKQYFLSPIGYIYIGVFLLMCSITFYSNIFLSQSTNFASIFSLGVTSLTFLVPVLTMRTFAEERKNSTEVLILTSPTSVKSMVFGKFIAAGLVVLLSIACTFLYYIILSFFGEPALATSLVAMLGFALLSLAYVACGMFISSLTENQVVSAIISMIAFLVLSFLSDLVPGFDPFSIIDAFTTFESGLISVHDVVLLLSFIGFFISMTVLVMNRRKYVK
jgi:ABC-2 type transport system permease protein